MLFVKRGLKEFWPIWVKKELRSVFTHTNPDPCLTKVEFQAWSWSWRRFGAACARPKCLWVAFPCAGGAWSSLQFQQGGDSGRRKALGL